MAFRAGRKVTTANLSWDADIQPLPDNDSQSSGNTWETWGSSITFSDPGTEVKVLAWVNGYSFDNASSAANTSLRVGISFDGGSTWDNGKDPRQQIGSASDAQRGSTTGMHLRSGTPTGDIQIRAQHLSTQTTTAFWNGTLMAQVIPVA